MALFNATLHALAPLFLLIVLGYALKQGRILHAAHVPIMNGIVLNVTLPALIIKGLLAAPPLSARMALPPLAIFVSEIITVGLALSAGRLFRLSRPVQGALLLVGVFGNTGFLGYPMTLALIPDQFPTAILIDQFAMTIPMYLFAVVVGSLFSANGSEPGEIIKAMLRFGRGPMFVSLMAGIVLHVIPWPPSITHLTVMQALGGVLSACLGYLGQGTTPLVLLALGVALRPDAVRAYLAPLGVACTLKLIISPLATWGICHAFHVHGELLAVGVLQAAMPTAVMASVLCAEHDLSGDFAVGVVFAGTVLSAFTVPVMLSLLR